MIMTHKKIRNALKIGKKKKNAALVNAARLCLKDLESDIYEPLDWYYENNIKNVKVALRKK